MNNALKDIIIFSLGAAFGAGIAYVVTKDTYSQIADEEINAVKERYKKMSEDESRAVSVRVAEATNKPEISTYYRSSIFNKEEEPVIEEPSEPEEKSEEDSSCPMIVNPSDATEDPDYDSFTLTYFDDDILADSKGDVLDAEWVEKHLGSTSVLDSFGEYEEDTVCVRNDEDKCYYVILRDEDTYYKIK